MDDYALVLNAGSSSLKFCVFERPRAKAGIWGHVATWKALVHRPASPSKMQAVQAWPIRTLLLVTDLKRLIRSLPGCVQNTAARACWELVIVWFMAAPTSLVQQSS